MRDCRDGRLSTQIEVLETLRMIVELPVARQQRTKPTSTCDPIVLARIDRHCLVPKDGDLELHSLTGLRAGRRTPR